MLLIQPILGVIKPQMCHLLSALCLAFLAKTCHFRTILKCK
jgi:hypothetical protein